MTVQYTDTVVVHYLVVLHLQYTDTVFAKYTDTVVVHSQCKVTDNLLVVEQYFVYSQCKESYMIQDSDKLLVVLLDM